MSRWSGVVIAFLAIMVQSSAAIPTGRRISEFQLQVGVWVYKGVDCRINNNRAFDVDFGSISIDEIDGQRFERQMEASISCQSGAPDEIRMVIQAAAAPFDQNLVSTTNTNLGLRLKGNGKAIIPNEEIRFDWHVPFVISAVPVKEANSNPATGSFSATATIELYIH